LTAVLTLLKSDALPLEDVTDHFEHYLVAREAARVVGAVGLEIYGLDALLRSLVVCTDRRGRGVGHQLVDHMLSYARERGVRTVYLLTTTAAAFFERLEFERCDRSSVPASIAETSEFASTCPASAVCMRRSLRPAPCCRR
jgi:amino-acid N-acetyltransferase